LKAQKYSIILKMKNVNVIINVLFQYFGWGKVVGGAVIEGVVNQFWEIRGTMME